MFRVAVLKRLGLVHVNVKNLNVGFKFSAIKKMSEAYSLHLHFSLSSLSISP